MQKDTCKNSEDMLLSRFRHLQNDKVARNP